MKEIKKFQLNEESVDVISREICTLLSQNSCGQQEITKYRLIAEETMLKWKEKFGRDKEIVFVGEAGRLTCGFRLELAAPKLDPLAKENDEFSIADRLVKKLDNEITYKYSGGKNILSASFSLSDNAYILRSVGKMVLPIAFQNLLTNIVSSSDAIMLGVLNQESLAAVSLASQITFIFTCIVGALVTGTTIFASQYWSCRDKDSVENILAVTLQLSAAVGMIFWILCLFFPHLLMSTLTNDEALIPLGCDYLRTLSWSFLVMSFAEVYLGLMKSTGRSAAGAAYAAGSLILNAVLNYIFIYGKLGFEPMGIAGAALSTLISRIAELTAIIAENRINKDARFRFSKIFSLKLKLRGDYLKITVPTLASVMLWAVSQYLMSAVVGHIGGDTVAANSIANIVKNLALSLMIGILTATSAIIGFQLGRSRFDKAVAYSRKMLTFGLVTGIISGIIVFGLSDVIIFCQNTLSAQAAVYLKFILSVYLVYFPFKSVSGIMSSGIINAGGQAKKCLIADLIFTWGIIVPLLLLGAFVFNWSPYVILVLVCMDEVLKAPYFYVIYKKGSWLQNLTRTAES